MKKWIAIIVCLIMCAAFISGCGTQKEEETTPARENDPAVVGTWSEDYFDSGYTFNEDGTGRDTFWDLPFTYTAYDGVITIKYEDETYGLDKYTYSVTDNCRFCLGRACINSCRFGAISKGEMRMHIDPDKCRECGLCAKACPYLRRSVPNLHIHLD